MSVTENRRDRDVLEQLDGLRPVLPRDAIAAARGRAQFLALAQSLRKSVSPKPVQRLLGWLESATIQTKERYPMATTLTSILLALAMTFGGAGATVYAAQAALPGDVLYPVKLGLEDAQVALSPDETTDAQLRFEFVQRRIQETVALSLGALRRRPCCRGSP